MDSQTRNQRQERIEKIKSALRSQLGPNTIDYLTTLVWEIAKQAIDEAKFPTIQHVGIRADPLDQVIEMNRQLADHVRYLQRQLDEAEAVILLDR